MSEVTQPTVPPPSGPPAKPWWRRWWAITLWVLLAIGLIGSLGDGEDKKAERVTLRATTPEQKPSTDRDGSTTTVSGRASTTTARPTTTLPPPTTTPPTTVATTLPPTTPAPTPPPTAAPAPPPTVANVYYANCDAVRAAGAAPLYAGEPGYSSSLDRDGDGVACES